MDLDSEFWVLWTWDGEGGGMDGGVCWREGRVDNVGGVVGEGPFKIGVGLACLSRFKLLRKMDEQSGMP